MAKQVTTQTTRRSRKANTTPGVASAPSKSAIAKAAATAAKSGEVTKAGEWDQGQVDGYVGEWLPKVQIANAAMVTKTLELCETWRDARVAFDRFCEENNLSKKSGGWSALVKESGVHLKTVQRMVKVGQAVHDGAFSSVPMESLPSGLSVLETLSRVQEPALIESAVASGELTSGTSRAKAIEWVEGVAKANPEAVPTIKPPTKEDIAKEEERKAEARQARIARAYDILKDEVPAPQQPGIIVSLMLDCGIDAAQITELYAERFADRQAKLAEEKAREKAESETTH